MIYVCDAMMGSGKTTAAINMINEHPERRYLYVTPYLSEVERIIDSCPMGNFQQPFSYGEGKLSNLHDLLARRRNIVSTHALFLSYTDETQRLIAEGGYTMVMDEVAEMFQQLSIAKDDVELLLQSNLFERDKDDPESLKLLNDSYEGEMAGEYVRCARYGKMVEWNGSFLYWFYPDDLLRAFEDVYVLTFMFRAQYQSYYFDLTGLTYEPLGVRTVDGEAEFFDGVSPPTLTASKIHVLDAARLCEIGDSKHALSSTWYQKHGPRDVGSMLRSVRTYEWNVPTNDFMWTSFKRNEAFLKKYGGKKSFVACNARGTNEFGDRHYLAYMVNYFMNPFTKQYLTAKGVTVDENGYALSEMLQWIFRSAIRNGEDIWVYVPSARMRGLLMEWLEMMQGKQNE